MFYKNYFLNRLRTNLAYRMDNFLQLVNRLIFMIVQIEIWKIIYGNNYNQVIASDYGNITLGNMIFYTAISHIIYIIVQNTTLDSVTADIRKGDISLQLIRPYSYTSITFLDVISQSLVASLFQALPLILYMKIFFSSYIVFTAPSFLLFLLSLILSFLIFFLINYILSLSAFWVVETGPLDMILSGVIKIFSGVWIPLWFFPEIVQNIANSLPFSAIYFTPLGIFTEKIAGLAVYFSLLKQLIWVVILVICVDMMWQRGIKKINIQGG